MIVVGPSWLEDIDVGPTEAATVEERLAILEEVVRPGARMRRRRRDVRLGRHDELGRKGLAILRGDDADLPGRNLRRRLLRHVEQERVDPIRPGADDRDLGTLEPAVVEERLAVLELVALDLVPEESSLRQRTPVDRLDGCDF